MALGLSPPLSASKPNLRRAYELFHGGKGYDAQAGVLGWFHIASIQVFEMAQSVG